MKGRIAMEAWPGRQTVHGPKTIIGAGQKSGIYYALDSDTGVDPVANGRSQRLRRPWIIDCGQRLCLCISMAASLFQPGPPSTSSMFALNASNGNILRSFAAGSSVIAGASIVDCIVPWDSGYAKLGIPGYTGNNKFRQGDHGNQNPSRDGNKPAQPGYAQRCVGVFGQLHLRMSARRAWKFSIKNVNSSSCGRDSGIARLPPDVWRSRTPNRPDRRWCGQL